MLTSKNPALPEPTPPPFTPIVPESEPPLSYEALQQQLAQAQQTITDLQSAPDTAEGKAVAKLKSGFELPKAEGHLTHVIETKVNGVPLAEPRYNVYDAGQYERMIVKQPGYAAEVVHKGKK